jgi:hypothetical protein
MSFVAVPLKGVLGIPTTVATVPIAIVIGCVISVCICNRVFSIVEAIFPDNDE